MKTKEETVLVGLAEALKNLPKDDLIDLSQEYFEKNRIMGEISRRKTDDNDEFAGKAYAKKASVYGQFAKAVEQVINCSHQSITDLIEDRIIRDEKTGTEA